MAGAARKERPQVGHAASSGPRNVAQEGHFGGVESASGRSASRLRVWHPSQRTWAGLVAWHSGHSTTRSISSRPRRTAADPHTSQRLMGRSWPPHRGQGGRAEAFRVIPRTSGGRRGPPARRRGSDASGGPARSRTARGAGPPPRPAEAGPAATPPAPPPPPPPPPPGARRPRPPGPPRGGGGGGGGAPPPGGGGGRRAAPRF